MKAQQLINKINRICKDNGVSPKTVDVNFRWSEDGDVWQLKRVEEDLFDAKTNKTLTSITLFPPESDLR